MMKHCISCGEHKPIRWPKEDPVACSMTCVTVAYMASAGAGPSDSVYCESCGETTNQCDFECLEDEEGE